MATMRDVAARAHVSQKTVSRVFNNDPHVRADTRDRVRRAMAELGYVANPIASVFRAGRVPALGIAVPDIADPFFAQIISTIDDVAREKNMSIVVASLGKNPGRESDIMRTLFSRAPRAVIMAPISSSQEYLHDSAGDTPVIFIDREPQGFSVPTIIHDNISGTRAGVRHLLDAGHTRIACLGDSDALPTTQARIRAYCDALSDAGIPIDHDLISMGATDRNSAELCIDHLMHCDQPPDAIFSSNARTSMYAMGAIYRHGLACVSFGDFPMADILTPPLCVIDQEPEYMGKEAARIALQAASSKVLCPRREKSVLRNAVRMNDPSPTSARILPVRVIHRASCRA